ncbi:DUF7662 domain-containing protein [Asanoa ferruginea]
MQHGADHGFHGPEKLPAIERYQRPDPVRPAVVSIRLVRQVPGMSKYSTLRDWLRSSGRSSVRMSFDELDDLVPGGLPPSAYRHVPWWSNESDPASTHSRSRLGWVAAGYRVETVNLTQRHVVFVRRADSAA